MYLQKLPEYQEKIAPRETSEKEKVELNENENEAFIEGSGEKSIKSVIFDTENGILKYMFCVWFCFLITLGKFLGKSSLSKFLCYIFMSKSNNEFFFQ